MAKREVQAMTAMVMPLVERNALVNEEELPFEVAGGDVLKLVVTKPAGTYFMLVSLSDDGAEWFMGALWDENTPEAERSFVVPVEALIPTPPDALRDVGSKRAGQSYRPKLARVLWSTVEPVTFGICREPCAS
jgi:hypothetical protein